MPRLAKRAQSHAHPFDPNITMMLGRRSDSNRWEARFKLPNGQSPIRSTGETDPVAAHKVAYDTYLRLREDVASGRGISTRWFKQVAEDVATDLDAQAKLLKANAPGTRKHHRALKHATCIRNCLIPALGHLPITGITDEVLSTYVGARTGRGGTAVSASTINNHNHSLQKVLQHANAKGWITTENMRRLPTGGARAAEPRSTFEPQEYAKLVGFMSDEWVASGRRKIERETRAILREYVIIAAATGIRPGTELDLVTWGAVNTEWMHEMGGGPYIVIHVSRHTGKTQRSRSVIAYQGEEGAVKAALARLRKLNPEATPGTPIFARPSDQKVPRDLHGAFEAVLSHPDVNLLKDRDGDRRAPYSLRHFYACSMLLRGFSYETLEKQMGTSAEMLSTYYSSRVTPLVQADRLSGAPADQRKALLSTPLGTGETELRQRLLLAAPDPKSRKLVVGKEGNITVGSQP